MGIGKFDVDSGRVWDEAQIQIAERRIRELEADIGKYVQINGDLATEVERLKGEVDERQKAADLIESMAAALRGFPRPGRPSVELTNIDNWREGPLAEALEKMGGE